MSGPLDALSSARPSVGGGPRAWVLALCLALLTLLVYARVYGAQFLSNDDTVNITENEYLSPPTLAGVRALWSEAYYGEYVPLSYTLWAAEAWLVARTDAAGQTTFEPWIFHTTGVLLHTLCALVVYSILRRLVHDDWAALLGAGLFAWHPLQVESVAWISETRGTLAGLFSLAAIYEYLRFRESGRPSLDTPAAPTRARYRHYALALGLYLLGLVSKGAAVSVPLILISFDWLWFRRPLWRSLITWGGWCVPAVVIAGVTSTAQGDLIAAFVPVPPWWQRPVVALDAIAYYLGKLLIPIGLTMDPCRTPQYVLSSWWVYLVAAIPPALAVVLWRLPHRRVWLTSLAIYVAVILPTSGLLVRAVQLNSTVNDRYIYLGLLGPALALAWLLAETPLRRARYEVALGLVLLAVLTIRQSGFWYDDRALAERIVSTNPQNPLALLSLANAHWREGDLARAEELLIRAAEINPHRPVTWHGNSLLMWGESTTLMQLGKFYVGTNRDDDAVRIFERAIREGELDVGPRLRLAEVLFRQGKHDRVIAEARLILDEAPELLEARRYLATSLMQRGQSVEAIEQWRLLVDAEPQSADAHLMLGVALAQTGQFDAAREELEKTLELRPADAMATDVLRQIDAQLRAPREEP